MITLMLAAFIVLLWFAICNYSDDDPFRPW